MKVYLNIVGVLVSIALVFGFVAPALISAESDMLVVIGGLVIIFSIPIWLKWIKYIFNNIGKKEDVKVTNIVPLIIMFLLLPMLMNCSKVPAGYVGVKVHLLGSEKGVDNEVLGVGRTFVGWNEELYTYPTFQINYVYTKDENEGSPTNEEFVFQTKEGMECSMDLGLSVHFLRDKISRMFQTYRKGPDEIRGVVVRNAIRDALNKVSATMAVEDVYGSGKAKMMDSVQVMAKAALDSNGIVIDKISLIGSIRLPAMVIQALNLKISATQRAQQRENELREAEAQAKKAVAQAQGEADANKIKMSTLTQQIIEWQRLENERLAISKWNGVLPSVTSGAVPFINLK